VGGESTRPGARGVSAREEMKKGPARSETSFQENQNSHFYRYHQAEVAQKAMGLGASLINDVSALRGDPRMAATVRKLDVPVVLMHMKGRPEPCNAIPGTGM